MHEVSVGAFDSPGDQQGLRIEVQAGLASAASFDGVLHDLVGSSCRRARFGSTPLGPPNDASGKFGYVDHAKFPAQPDRDRCCRNDRGTETLECQ